MTNSKKKKVTNEKPVSLAPLKFKESLSALLKINLEEDKEEKESEKKNEPEQK